MAASTPSSSLSGVAEMTITSIPSGKSSASSQARAKKRPSSPASSGCLTLINSKKKKITLVPSGSQSLAQVSAVDVVAEVKVAGASELNSANVEPSVSAKPMPFKNLTFVHSGIGGALAGKKNRTWKNLKQILAAERALPWQLNDPSYYSIDAPPSLKPAKKYSDISGLPANYTDPQTKLRFTSSEEFSYIRQLPTDVVSGYLNLRKASCIVP